MKSPRSAPTPWQLHERLERQITEADRKYPKRQIWARIRRTEDQIYRDASDPVRPCKPAQRVVDIEVKEPGYIRRVLLAASLRPTRPELRRLPQPKRRK